MGGCASCQSDEHKFTPRYNSKYSRRKWTSSKRTRVEKAQSGKVPDSPPLSRYVKTGSVYGAKFVLKDEPDRQSKHIPDVVDVKSSESSPTKRVHFPEQTTLDSSDATPALMNNNSEGVLNIPSENSPPKDIIRRRKTGDSPEQNNVSTADTQSTNDNTEHVLNRNSESSDNSLPNNELEDNKADVTNNCRMNTSNNLDEDMLKEDNNSIKDEKIEHHECIKDTSDDNSINVGETESCELKDDNSSQIIESHLI